jgi:aminoglycoside-2''-adenylyltransferase
MNEFESAPHPACFVPDLAQWQAWTPGEITRRLSGVQAPWCVAAGWAIDLFLGHQRRTHDDLEIAVPHEHFEDVAAALTGYELCVVGSGYAVPLAQAGSLWNSWHQTWVREPASGSWKLDIFREPSVDGQWVCRRDARIQLPYDRLIEHSETGIPYACPEVVLLFKAKASRPKDQSDFAAVLPHLGRDRRRWLSGSLELIHPGHHWLPELR